MSWLNDLTANRYLKSYFNGFVDVSGGDIICRNGKLNIVSGNVSLGNQTITVNDVYNFINFPQNVHIYGTQQLDYNNITYNVGYELTTLKTNINNISTSNFVDISTNQIIATGSKTWSARQIFSNDIQLDGVLRLSNNQVTLANSDLTKIKNIVSTTSDVQTQLDSHTTNISTLTNNLTNISYTSNVNTTYFSGFLNFNPSAISSTAINNSSFVSLTGAQTIAGNKTFSSNIIVSSTGNGNFNGLLQALGTYLRVDGTLQLGGNTITVTQATLQKLQYLSTVSSDIQTQINGINPSSILSTANTWSQIQTFSLPPVMSGASITASTIPSTAINNTTFLDLGTNGQIVTGNKTWQGNINANSQTVNPTQLGYLSGVTSAIQTQLNSCAKTASLNTFSLAQVFSNNLRLDGQLVLNGGLMAINNSVLQYLNGVSSNIQTQFSGCAQIALSNTYTLAQTFSNNIRLDGSLLLSSGTITISNSVLQYLNGLAGNIQDQFSSLNTKITNLFSYQPIGTITMGLMTQQLPFLLCDGSAISRTTYSTLFALIGTGYGSGDGSTTFNIPCYVGMFLRGHGFQTINGVLYSSAGTMANFQPDTMQDHQHQGQSGQYLGTGTTTVSTNGYAALAVKQPSVNNFAATGNVGTTGYRLSSETRPANYSCYYFIKVL